MFITPIFIINLEKSTDRKAYMQAQFEQLFSNNLIQEIHFFDAIYGKSNPNHPLFQRYNENKRLNAKGYPLTLGQLGCYASHYSMWEKCVELDYPIIVLEDDGEIESTIYEKQKKRRSLKIVIMRELFNLKTNIKRRIYNLFH